MPHHAQPKTRKGLEPALLAGCLKEKGEGQKGDEGRRHDAGTGRRAEREALQEKSEGGWKRERKGKIEACGWTLGPLF